jgi:hypothetical protein
MRTSTRRLSFTAFSLVATLPFISLLFIPLTLSAATNSCEALFDSPSSGLSYDLIAINENAIASRESYSAVHGRGLGSYEESMGVRFKAALAKSKNWLDSGAGFALAGNEAAETLGKRVVAINPQDFYSPILDFASSGYPPAGHWETINGKEYFVKGDIVLDTSPIFGLRPYKVSGIRQNYFYWLALSWNHKSVSGARDNWRELCPAFLLIGLLTRAT